MSSILVFGLALLAAVLFSDLAHRSVLSTAVLFLFVGIAAGEAGLGVVAPADETLTLLAELALFSVLFTDAMRVGLRDLRSAWRLPGRALVLGMPLTLAATALLAWGLTGLGLVGALLLGAVLAPTDPVLAAAIVGRQDIPFRLRHLLNIESGLNDGLALPVVIVLIDVTSHAPIEPGALAAEALGGLALGGAGGLAGGLLLRASWAKASEAYEPLGTVAVAVVVFATAELTGANAFLAAFTAGVAVASMRDPESRGTTDFDELTAELLKLAALLVFGALLSPAFLAGFSVGDYVFVAAALVLARPAALGLALIGSGLTRREWMAAAWFGPKGFATVVYALLVLDAHLPRGDEIFHLAGAVVALSIVAHSSTDVLIARSFERAEERDRRTAGRPGIADGKDLGAGSQRDGPHGPVGRDLEG